MTKHFFLTFLLSFFLLSCSKNEDSFYSKTGESSVGDSKGDDGDGSVDDDGDKDKGDDSDKDDDGPGKDDDGDDKDKNGGSSGGGDKDKEKDKGKGCEPRKDKHGDDEKCLKHYDANSLHSDSKKLSCGDKNSTFALCHKEKDKHHLTFVSKAVVESNLAKDQGDFLLRCNDLGIDAIQRNKFNNDRCNCKN